MNHHCLNMRIIESCQRIGIELQRCYLVFPASGCRPQTAESIRALFTNWFIAVEIGSDGPVPQSKIVFPFTNQSENSLFLSLELCVGQLMIIPVNEYSILACNVPISVY